MTQCDARNVTKYIIQKKKKGQVDILLLGTRESSEASMCSVQPGEMGNAIIGRGML